MTRTHGDQPFELAVIGGGSAGFAAAIRAAEEGLQVALINSGTIGGTCVNVGCIPSKALIRAGTAHHGRFQHPFDGIATDEGDLDWNAVRTQKDRLVETLRQSKYVEVLAVYSTVSLFEQQARLEPGGGARLDDGTLISAPRIVVTTGAAPLIPEIPGLSEVDYLDSTSVMALRDLPSSMIVLGAGSVGLELAHDNSITDISALSGLTSLAMLHLSGNPNLNNIQPLLDNTGLGAGDQVSLTDTNVSCTDVAALKAKGVTVLSGCP